MRPFLSFFGSKWRAAPRYPAPRYPTIIEPFAGAAGYSIRYADRNVRLYDLDDAICGVWDFLIHATAADVRAIPLDVDHVDEIPDSFSQEVRWLVGFWMNAAAATPCLQRSAWAKKHPGKAFWGPMIQERLAEQVQHIRHWTITQASYEAIPPYEATWFVDPPYIEAGKHYRHGSEAIDFDALGHWCRGLVGDVIVCENAGARWLPFEPFATIKAAHGAGRVGVSHEVIWTSSSLAA